MPKESEQSDMSRRDFLRTGAGSTAVGLVSQRRFAEIAPPGVLSVNDRVRVAVIRFHRRRNYQIQCLVRLQNVETASLCGVYEPIAEQPIAKVEKMDRPKPRGCQDVRKLLDDKSIGAVTIATPNYRHSLMGIWACKTGNAVYVEKPCSHNLWEGSQFIRATRKYNRIVQHGTQMRSAVVIRNAIKKLRSGLIGDVFTAHSLCSKWRNTIGHTPPSAARWRPRRSSAVRHPGKRLSVSEVPGFLEL